MHTEEKLGVKNYQGSFYKVDPLGLLVMSTFRVKGMDRVTHFVFQ